MFPNYKSPFTLQSVCLDELIHGIKQLIALLKRVFYDLQRDASLSLRRLEGI